MTVWQLTWYYLVHAILILVPLVAECVCVRVCFLVAIMPVLSAVLISDLGQIHHQCI